MTLEDQIAWIGSIQYWFQSEAEAENLEYIKASLRRLHQLDQEADATADKKKEESKYEKYSEFIEVYDQFCRSYIGVGAKIDGAQGRALKHIIAYLIDQNKRKDEQGALDAWRYVLTNWGKLSEFLRKQTSILLINKNLQEILTQLRHAGKSSGQTAAANVKQRVARRRHDRPGETDKHA